MDITLHTIEDKIFFGLKIIGDRQKEEKFLLHQEMIGSLIMHQVMDHSYPDSI